MNPLDEERNWKSAALSIFEVTENKIINVQTTIKLVEKIDKINKMDVFSGRCGIIKK